MHKCGFSFNCQCDSASVNPKALFRSSGLWESALFMWKDPPSTWTALPRAAQAKTTGLSSFPLLALGLTGDFLYFVASGADSRLTEAASFKFQCGLSLCSPGIPRLSLKPGLQGSLAPWPGQLLGSEPLHCWTTLTNRS